MINSLLIYEYKKEAEPLSLPTFIRYVNSIKNNKLSIASAIVIQEEIPEKGRVLFNKIVIGHPEHVYDEGGILIGTYTSDEILYDDILIKYHSGIECSSVDYYFAIQRVLQLDVGRRELPIYIKS